MYYSLSERIATCGEVYMLYKTLNPPKIQPAIKLSFLKVIIEQIKRKIKPKFHGTLTCHGPAKLGELALKYNKQQCGHLKCPCIERFHEIIPKRFRILL